MFFTDVGLSQHRVSWCLAEGLVSVALHRVSWCLAEGLVSVALHRVSWCLAEGLNKWRSALKYWK